MNGLRQSLLTILAVAAVLAVASLLPAGQVWNIAGTFGTSFVNDKPADFYGSLVFPVDGTMEVGKVNLMIEGEPLLREADFVMTMNLPGTLMQPWDTRLYSGVFEEKPWTMLTIDYDREAGAIMDPATLDGGGGWDSWLVSFPDYTAGSIDYMGDTPQVNEPSAMALAALGFVVVFGVLRDAQRR
jgi:hypothetical protein